MPTLILIFKKVLEKTKDNPVFYIQYAHARCHSVMRMAKEFMTGKNNICSIPLNCLNDEDELQLIKFLAGWPRQVEIAALAREPHRLCYYLYEIAQQFHMLGIRKRTTLFCALFFLKIESLRGLGCP